MKKVLAKGFNKMYMCTVGYMSFNMHKIWKVNKATTNDKVGRLLRHSVQCDI